MGVRLFFMIVLVSFKVSHGYPTDKLSGDELAIVNEQETSEETTTLNEQSTEKPTEQPEVDTTEAGFTDDKEPNNKSDASPPEASDDNGEDSNSEHDEDYDMSDFYEKLFGMKQNTPEVTCLYDLTWYTVTCHEITKT